MKLGLVTDSTCDLPFYLIEQYGIAVVPSILILDGKEYADGRGISREEFYARLPEYKSQPTTAAPSIGEFTTQYKKLFDQGCDNILSIHAAEHLTSIINAARQAAQESENHITVMDSLSLSLGLGFQVLAAAEHIDKGLEAALAAVEATRRRLHVYAALDTMKYLSKSGRVPGAVAALGGLLSIKPLVQVIDGEVKAVGAVRTTKQANERMYSMFNANGPFERLAILHTNAEARAKEFLNTVMQEASQSVPREVLMVNVTPVIGTHVGPNALGFAAVRKL
ncbi:MAG TPA: DegV family protein [Anaerolineales bacterium]|jgi:DegV family protein with EDD domain|nr:DegV family protein [Anaerolineales bacterium]